MAAAEDVFSRASGGPWRRSTLRLHPAGRQSMNGAGIVAEILKREGTENAFPGVAQAYAKNVPLLIISGGLALAKQYVRPAFRAAEVYQPVTKWSALAHNVQELPDLMRRAYHAMRSGKAGPVLIEVPDEVFEAEFRGALDYVPVPMQRSAPDPDAVKKAAQMLLAAKNPILWAGQGVHYAQA